MSFLEEVKEFAEQFDTGTELVYALQERFNSINVEQIAQGRWTQFLQHTFERDGEYVAVTVEEGLTEYQEDEGYEIYPVVPVPSVKFVKVV